MMAMAHGHLPAVIPYFRSALESRELRAQTGDGGGGGGLRSKVSDIKTGIEDARLRQWGLASRLPPSVPIAWKPILPSPQGPQDDSKDANNTLMKIDDPAQPSSSSSSRRSKTSFLSLPPELRIKIYALVLGDEPEILQPSGCCTYRGSFPSTWPRWQRTRTDADAPSPTLCRTIGLGGTSFQQRVSLPPRRSLRYGAVAWMLLGGGDENDDDDDNGRSGVVGTTATMKTNSTTTTHITDLMRTCRPVYRDLLDRLYADNTISLFGPDMLRFFLGNVSPEGLQQVRYVHLALPLPAGSESSWTKRSRYRDEVEGAVAAMGRTMTGLRELDLEVAVLWEQPVGGGGSGERGFWEWLTRGVVMGGLLLSGDDGGEGGEGRSNQRRRQFLDKFIMKVSVYQRQQRGSSSGPAKRVRRSVDEWIPATVPLATFHQGEYIALQEMVTGRRRKGDWSSVPGETTTTSTSVTSQATSVSPSLPPATASSSPSRGRSWREIILM